METDYKMICGWWKGHDWQPVPACSLSRNGLIVSENDMDLSVGFLYGTDSDISSIEWVLSNPSAPIFRRSIGVKLLIKRLTELSKDIGYGVCMTWLVSRSLKKVYAENGYVKGDENLTHMVRRFV